MVLNIAAIGSLIKRVERGGRESSRASSRVHDPRARRDASSSR
jgi:hypothetical protein